MIIKIYTQAEFDEIDMDCFDFTLIQIYGKNITVRHNPENSLISAHTGAVVYVYGHAKVLAYHDALIFAYENASIYAWDTSTVIAHNDSIVAIYGQATLEDLRTKS